MDPSPGFNSLSFEPNVNQNDETSTISELLRKLTDAAKGHSQKFDTLRATDTKLFVNYVKTRRGGEGRIGRDQNGADGPDKLLDLWTRWWGERRGGGRWGKEGGRGRCLDPPRCVIVEISVASEKGRGGGEGRPTSEGRRRTGHGCKPRVLSFFVPSLPFPPREISNVPSPPPPAVKKFRSAINASPNKERESGRKMARALLLPPSSRDHPTDPRWMIFFSFFQNILFTRKFLFRLFSSCYADKEERSWIFLWIVRKRGMARSFRIFFSFQDISKYIFRFVFFFFFF